MPKGRPKKDKSQLHNLPLRVMVTASQKALIDEAVGLEGADFSDWARSVLVRTAQERIARDRARTPNADS